MNLKGQAYPGNLRPFVYFQFFNEPESYSTLAVGPDPVYDSTFTFNITTTPELKKYLDTESLEFIVFDDNAPIKEGSQDIIGTAKVPLSALLLDTAAEGTYMIYNLRGIDSGKIAIRIAWRDSKADQTGYGTPLTEVWEKESYERIAKALASRGLGIESGFKVFDQDQDGLISPQEFRNTILITLRLPLSEQEIQLLINACNFIEGGITKTIFRQKLSGLLPSDRAIESQDTWEEIILNKVRDRIQEKGLSIYQAFAAFDENRDGFISHNEFIKTFKTMQLGLTEDEINRMLTYFDPRKTGRIDYNNFCDRVQNAQNSSRKRIWEEEILNKVRNRIEEKGLSVRQAFGAFDENKDGTISSSEFIKAFRVMELGLTDQEIYNMMNYFDPKKTGTIDYNIFCDKILQKVDSWEEVILNKVRQRINEKGLTPRQAFAAFDENKDGIINTSEFVKTFKIMELGLTDKEIVDIMGFFDPRKTGSIDYNIFCTKVQGTTAIKQGESWEVTILNKIRKRINEKGLSVKQAFSAFDENKDGIISSSEFMKAFKIMDLGLTEQEIADMLRFFDPKKTGKIDYNIFCDKITQTESSQAKAVNWEEEILNRVRNRISEKGLSVKQTFSAFDENKDGVISSAEFIKAFRIMELGLTERDIYDIMNYFDPRKTGSIDYRIFCDRILQVSSSATIETKEQVILEKVRKRISDKGLSVRQTFTAFDENRDGIISSAEFIKAFKIMDLGINENDIFEMITLFDPKKTGKIDYKSFCDKILQTNISKQPDFTSPRHFEINVGKSNESWEQVILNKVRKRIAEKGLSIRQAFSAFDENKDGSISSTEFMNAFKIMDLGLTEKEIVNMMNYFDTKKTGSIDYIAFCDKVQSSFTPRETETWEETILKKVKNRIHDKGLSIRQTFNAFDQNKDGVISSMEFLKAFKIMDLGLSDQDIADMLKYFDPGRTGKINYNVFCEKCGN